jgi:hypothetical protein
MTPESMGDVWGSDSGLWERNEDCGRKGSLTRQSCRPLRKELRKIRTSAEWVAELGEMKLYCCLWESGEESVVKIKKLTATRGFRWLCLFLHVERERYFEARGAELIPKILEQKSVACWVRVYNLRGH